MRALGAPIPADEERVYGEGGSGGRQAGEALPGRGAARGWRARDLADHRDLDGQPGGCQPRSCRGGVHGARRGRAGAGAALRGSRPDDVAAARRDAAARTTGSTSARRFGQAVISEAELAEGRLSGSDEVTIAFADLVGFTRLGESLEIEQIGELTGRLFTLASEAARPPVRLVKMIGDAAMFSSRETVPLLESVVEPRRCRGQRGDPLTACRRRSRPGAEPRGRLVRAPRQPRRPDHRLCATGQRRRRAGREGRRGVGGRGRLQVLVRGQASLQGDRGRGAGAPRPASRGSLSAALIRA